MMRTKRPTGHGLLQVMLITAVALALVLALWLPAAAAQGDLSRFVLQNSYEPGRFADVPDSEWYAVDVANAYRLGLMNGDSDTTFDPKGNVTVAQVYTITARISDLYFGEETVFAAGDPWYQCYVDYCTAHDIGLGASVDFEVEATRLQFASMISSVFAASDTAGLAPINSVQRLPDTDDPAVLRLYNAGILGGSDDYGTFHPEAKISRAEVAAIINRVALPQNRLKLDLMKMPEDSDTVTVGGRIFYIGQPVSLLPAADEVLPSTQGYTAYVYGTGSYENFVIAGVSGGKVAALLAAGGGYNYMGITAHTALNTVKGLSAMPNIPNYYSKAVETNTLSLSVDYDYEAGDFTTALPWMLYLKSNAVRLPVVTTQEAIDGECRLIFHLTNAYRVYWGLKPVAYSAAAAASARLHCEDMARNNFLGHVGSDGSGIAERLAAQGVYAFLAENCYKGDCSAMRAMNSWVASTGWSKDTHTFTGDRHRENIRYGVRTALGVGGAVSSQRNSSGIPYTYYVQDFIC